MVHTGVGDWDYSGFHKYGDDPFVPVNKNPYEPPTASLIKVRIGSSWVSKPVYVYHGGQWVEKPVKRWNGLSWLEI